METKFCHKCQQTKPITEFYKGNRGGCKKCVRKYQNEYYKKNYATPPQKEQLPENYKRCSNCKEVKPLTKFYRDKGQSDGYAHRCKRCSDKGRKKRRQREKERNPLYTVSLPEGYKVCRKCIKMLPVSEFNKAYGKLRSRCKQCDSEHKRTKKYKDWQREYQRRPEVKKKTRRNKQRYRGKAKSREKERAYRIEYIQRPEVKLRNKKYGEQYRSHPENQEKARQRVKEWRKTNPEKKRHNDKIRHKREKKLEGYYTLEQWETLCNFFGGICPCCGQEVESFELDHIIPLTWPGTSNYISNAQPLCKPCNCAKGNHRAIDYRPAHVREWAERETKRAKQWAAAEAEEKAEAAEYKIRHKS